MVVFFTLLYNNDIYFKEKYDFWAIYLPYKQTNKIYTIERRKGMLKMALGTTLKPSTSPSKGFTITPLTSDSYKNDQLMREKMHLYHKKYQDNYQNFNRYYLRYPETDLGTTRSYVFLTRPDCYLVTGTGKKMKLNEYATIDDKWQYYWRFHHIILQSLTNTLHPDHDFVSFLQGKVKSCQLPDIAIKQYQMTQLYTGYQFPYPGNTIESTTGGTFDMTFVEDHQFRVVKFFDMWLKYMNDVQLNILKPKKEYIYSNEADYASSAYIIVTTADGKTILYWAKYTGICGRA